MRGRAFLDTNVLVYAFGVDDYKKPIADRLLVEGASIGVQTLNEFVNVQLGKLKKSWPEVHYRLLIVEKLCPPPVPITKQVYYRGLGIAEETGFHIYDSMMLAAAIEASCTIFYSEDMQDGQVIGDMTIRNPFA